MSNLSLRGRIEVAFGRWGRFVVGRRWWVIVACLSVTSALVYRLPELRVDNSDEAYLKGNDPDRIAYDRFREQFDSEDRIGVILHPPDIFDLGFLRKLRDFHEEIEGEVPYVEEVTSLVNARNTRGEEDELIVEDLLERWPETEADLEVLRGRVLSNPLYVNILISQNADYTVVSLKPFTYSTLRPDTDLLGGFDAPEDGEAIVDPEYLTDRESFALVESLQQIVARYEGPDFEAHLIGGRAFEHRVAVAMQRDVGVFMSLCILVIGLLLYLLFQRVEAVVLPLLVVLASVSASMGLMVWLDIPFSLTLNMLPAFLLVLGICDSVHILTIFYQQLGAGHSREQAIAGALGHSGLPVVMTSITTACGLFSFSFAELAPVAQLGILAPAGVMLAMAYSLSLLPALLALAPLRRGASRKGAAVRALLDRTLAGAGSLSTRHPFRVLAITALLLLLGLPGLLRISFSHDGRRWFPEDEPIRQAVELADREFKGATVVEVLVQTQRENGLHEPETLRRIERLMRHSETMEIGDLPVNKAVSLVDVIKEIHQALNGNRAGSRVLPEDRQLIAQELLLFENSGTDDLEDVTDTRFQTARVTIRMPWVDAMLYPPFLEEFQRSFEEILGPELGFEMTGGVVIFSRIFEAVILSMARSYAFSLAVITPIMVLLIGSLQRGLVAMIPNLVPIYAILALMGWLAIPLDAATLLVGGVVIGLAVDDTIHFMHKFGRYYEESGDPHDAVHRTLTTTGSALLFTSLVISLGFSVFMAGYMRNIVSFGLLVSASAVLAFLCDVLLAPALMVLVTRFERTRSSSEAVAGSPATR